MDADRWARVAQVYQMALERPPHERQSYLAAVCGEDEDLHREVASLLSQAEKPVLIDAPVWHAAAPVLDDNPAVQPGTRIGPYEVIAFIGEGGMGQVYRARDTTLGRDVALKVLPATFSSDADRVARFRREAHVLASLNHPHIATIHGFETSGTIHALVLELVEGPTLADRIAESRIPLDEALPIAQQIADALEAAHERGIVHRDLKPANIKLRSDGTVKVLDFGLAKAVEADPSSTLEHGSSVAMTASPTVASPALTAMGVILGTAAYMAPEQAKGKPAEKRSDIWAFGCVLYEMLTGKRAFEGEDVSDTLAAVLRGEPNWSRLPATAPVSIGRLLRRCLEKDQRRRLPAIAAARLEIDETIEGNGSEPEASAVPLPTVWRRWLPWAVAAIFGIAAIGLGGLALRPAPGLSETHTVEFTIAQPEDTSLTGVFGGGNTTTPQFSLSPDGRFVVFVAVTSGPGVSALWLRALDSQESRMLPGTEQAAYPFWSPDSRSIAFFADDKLKRVLVTGGSPVILCDAGIGRGGTWNRDDVIVFASGGSGRGSGSLERVSAGGGAVTPVTTINDTRGERHEWPHFLPDGRHFLYISRPRTTDQPGELKVGALDTNDSTTLFPVESSVTYGFGHLLFWRDRSVLAQPFDPAIRRTTGDSFPVVAQVGRDESRWNMSFATSDSGVMAYAQNAESTTSRLTWRDRSGGTIGIVGEPGTFRRVTLAPDERRAGLVRQERGTDIWIADLMRSISSPLIASPANESSPIWSPDSTRIAFYSDRNQPGSGDLYVRAADGSGVEGLLLKADSSQVPSDWSRDGRHILYTQVVRAGLDLDVWVLPLSGDRKAFPFVQTPAREDNGVFSPDGRWIAYQSNESGRNEVWVQPFPATGAKFLISRAGGIEPRWRGDGKELYFLAPDGTMMATGNPVGGQFSETPRPLFATDLPSIVGGGRSSYAVTRDGQRFLTIEPEGSKPPALTVVVNWQAALNR